MDHIRASAGMCFAHYVSVCVCVLQNSEKKKMYVINYLSTETKQTMSMNKCTERRRSCKTFHIHEYSKILSSKRTICQQYMIGRHLLLISRHASTSTVKLNEKNWAENEMQKKIWTLLKIWIFYTVLNSIVSRLRDVYMTSFSNANCNKKIYGNCVHACTHMESWIKWHYQKRSGW